MPKLTLWLFLALIAASPSEADTAKIRFGGLTCVQRLHQATLGLSPLTALRESQIAKYLDDSMSLFDMGKRFGVLAAGFYRNTYPDLKRISHLIQLAEKSHLGGTNTFLVGTRVPWLEAVERPIQSWVLTEYRGKFSDEVKLAVFEITHTDGSLSQVLGFRAGEEIDVSAKRDYRRISNVFILSNGPDEAPTARQFDPNRNGYGLEATPLASEIALRDLQNLQSNMLVHRVTTDADVAAAEERARLAKAAAAKGTTVDNSATELPPSGGPVVVFQRDGG